jgi:phospholipase A1
MLLSVPAAASLAATDAANTRSSAIQDCLLSKLEYAPAETTVAELRAQCELIGAQSSLPEAAQDVPLTPVQERMFEDKVNYDRPFMISPFQPNFFIATYSDNPNEEPYAAAGQGDILDNSEAKFQVSIKAPFWRNMFGTNNDLIGAYTSTSWWQINNDDVSSAFRETNYEPEVFVRHYGGPKLLGGEVAALDLGLNHESNGRSELLSRSWNRVMGRAYLDFDDVAIALRAWYRIPEDDEDDDNPHMRRYYGAGDILVAYAPNKNTFSAMFRPGTEENGLQLTWSYPVSPIFRIYAEYWNGYGESLIDYDARTERIGIGFALNDFLQR